MDYKKHIIIINTLVFILKVVRKTFSIFKILLNTDSTLYINQ